MLQIAALFVAGTAALDDSGAIYATRIPTTWFDVEQIPVMARIPIVLVVHARAGGDYDPELHVVCKDPAGVPRGNMQASWHWPDEENRPSKYRCFTQEFAFSIDTEGEYTLGAYYDAQGRIEIATPIPIYIALSATHAGDR
ncbi:hypothetical protein [Mycobacterium sp. 852002-51057_SCH5723018]|uniref:hypothetical protein n=1 Tax=Mycobacterium sp. 852002-51057_SCH5723018 TaxID=1834094 RepID=UPI0007FDBA18|nr:hypothetical protein [Mycobacterium sp. 852002-51057_SCH5723018]OBG19592.1 hypothetical protein A5764_16460 [Mycobacterium sp. 852002-51057_SCH5723018]